ncbi:mevalonate kinase [Pokkaliibacter sp. CJK22405]|uniref:mevalonate kinase family protein n=1 Tax=Pokkaliibacter sp. CJK22405 TaxID=3384615 RepID=UPI0039847EB4
MIHASAPAKIILSGDHSVVYGAPALVAAISPRVKVTLQELPEPIVRLHADGQHAEMSIPDCLELQAELDELHDDFMEGEISVHDVLESGSELFFYALSQWLQPDARKGVELWMDSPIPIGCGLGSSAATIAAVCCAAGKFFGEPLEDLQSLVAQVRFIERLQHGRGSALDASAVVFGGVVHLADTLTEQAPLDNNWWVVHTGKPASSTGECVAAVREKYEDSPIWQRFSEVTNRFQAAMTAGDEPALAQAIKDNQRLLEELGLVPERVQSFVRRIEIAGGAAKICGAGCIVGEGAGAVLVRGVDPTTLAEEAGYGCQPIIGDRHGVRLEPA